jgi:hypothetical protein
MGVLEDAGVGKLQLQQGVLGAQSLHGYWLCTKRLNMRTLVGA